MGLKAAEPLQIAPEELASYLSAKHAIYMDVADASYYLTDANENYWRVQDTAVLNDKGHYTDVTTPVAAVEEFLAEPAVAGKSVADLAGAATFYASEKK
jgi:phage antirepressor YoqD-like protein